MEARRAETVRPVDDSPTGRAGCTADKFPLRNTIPCVKMKRLHVDIFDQNSLADCNAILTDAAAITNTNDQPFEGSSYQLTRSKGHKLMVIVLYQQGCRTIARSIASDLRKAFDGFVEVTLIAASSSSFPSTTQSWDDLLIVIYNDKDFPSAGSSFITRYLNKRPQAHNLLPVAIDPAAKKPPKAAAAIKALSMIARRKA